MKIYDLLYEIYVKIVFNFTCIPIFFIIWYVPILLKKTYFYFKENFMHSPSKKILKHLFITIELREARKSKVVTLVHYSPL